MRARNPVPPSPAALVLTNNYTLRALVAEWSADLTGCRFADAFSQARDELTLAVAAPEAEWMLRLSVRPPHYVFRAGGYSRARRNVATVFEPAFGCRITGLHVAERDRLLYLDLEDDLQIRATLFGPRANVFLTGADGVVREAFQGDAEWSGRPAPEARPAPPVETFDEFERRWRPDRRHLDQAVAAAFPLFDRLLAAETVHRAGVASGPPADCTPAEQRRLFDAGRALAAELERPHPHVYWRGRLAEAFALVPLQHLAGLEAEPFDAVDAGVRVFVRRTLAQAQFRKRYEPMEKALSLAAARDRERVDRMLEELSNESRADRYEQWGHLLMASAPAVPPGADHVELPDLFAADSASGTVVTIPLDPALSAVENAGRYYDRARRTRRARAEAEVRLVDTERRAGEAGRLLERLRHIDALPELEQFTRAEAATLGPFMRGEAEGDEAVPFRRFPLPHGYEVWVGRNAKQNDQLTFRYAQKHDLWMHARGVPGSHAVLRLPNRQAVPPRPVVEQAAAVAAYFSKARGSSLVPVMVAPRKYVRKPKGAAPGAVVVEREEVVLVTPALPA